MAEDERVQNKEVTFGAEDYLNNLRALKETTVSKEDYNKVLAENKKLAKALTNGYYQDPNAAPATPAKSTEELRTDLLTNKFHNDLEYFTTVLDLRESIINAGGADPFLPQSRDYMPTGDEIATADRVARNLRECIDYADGDPTVFKNELMRRCGEKPKFKK